jgi:hypothetical protein
LKSIQDGLDGLCIPEPVSDTFLFNPAWPEHEAYHLKKDIYYATMLGANPDDMLDHHQIRHLLNDLSSSTPQLPSQHSGQRILLGGDGSKPKSNNPCPGALVPLWPRHVVHQVELLLCVIGVTHILHTGITMLICLWQVRTLASLQYKQT